MRTFQLNNEQLQSLRGFHREAKKRSAPEAYRINAVILLGTGWTLKETSDALLLDEETLSSYVKKYEEGQLEDLLKMDYQGRDSKLSIEEMVALEEHLKENLYQTTAQVVAHVYKNHGVLYSRSGMSALLHRLGFTYKKPKLVPVGLNEELQEQFIEVLMEFIETKSDKEPILFYDSTHPQYNTLADYGWIKKGAEVFLPSHSARGRVNVSGAIDVETLNVITSFPEKVNAETTVACLKRIERFYPEAERIHIVLDNASSHHSKLVRNFLASSKINLVFLPPYSPNLNLIERLWGYLRRTILSNHYYEKISDFRDAIVSFFKKLRWRKKELSDLMTLEFQELPSGFT